MTYHRSRSHSGRLGIILQIFSIPAWIAITSAHLGSWQIRWSHWSWDGRAMRFTFEVPWSREPRFDLYRANADDGCHTRGLSGRR